MNEHHTISWVYRCFLRLFPSSFRQEFADEMVALFQERLNVAAAHGRTALLAFFLRELPGLIVGGFHQRVYAWQTRPLLMAQTGGGVTALVGRAIPWRKIIFCLACLLPLLPVVIYLTGLNALRRSENRRVVNQVALADFDGDGRQDALIILNRLAFDHPPDRLLLNEGDGRFTASDLWPATGYAQAVAAGDLTGNGRMDVAIAYTFGGLARVLNDDSGTLVPFGFVPQNLPYSSKDVALGDLDGDGRLDAFITGCCPGGQVWLNRGDGLLVRGQQRLGPAVSQAAALADLNGDGALDAFAVVGRDGPDEIWLNDGQGDFTQGQRFGKGFTAVIFLADLDGDGDLDIVAGGNTNAQVWLNDGAGQFHRGQRIRYGRDQSITVGDVTGDGIVDIFVAGVESYQVWRGVGDGRFTAIARGGW